MPDDPWGPIDLKNWHQTPAVSGRLATERDVEEGRAVFASHDSGAHPFPVELPAPAVVSEEGIGVPTPVIVIQAEELDDEHIAIGFRYLDGGTGICMAAETEFLAEPDERFRQY